MNISSILITILGIIVILALYVVSRVSKNNLPNKEISSLPELKDKDGQLFTSILDDIPASDDLTPAIQTISANKNTNNEKVVQANDTQSKTKQLVLFISAKDKEGLKGDLVKQVLESNDLRLGDKDIYHYFVEDDSANKKSLFRVANGVSPWTLTTDDLHQKHIMGLSLVMLIPNAISNEKSLSIYFDSAESIAKSLNGVIKNQQQEIMTEAEKLKLLADFS